MGRPWFALYAADLLVDERVRQLTDRRFRLLVTCWCHACLNDGIPEDPAALGRLLQIKTDSARNLSVFLSDFFQKSERNPGRLVSKRMEADAVAYERKVEALRLNGRMGGRSKKANASPDEKQMQPQPQPQPQPQKEQVPKTPRKRGPQKAEPASLESILQGGKGTPFWESYWKLVSTFGGQMKNPAPRSTAALYMSATVGYHPDHIQEKALALRSQTSDAKFMPQLAKWLEGHGYATPDLLPQPISTNGANHARSPHHRAEVDAAYIETLGRRTSSPAASGDPDPELHSLFESHPA